MGQDKANRPCTRRDLLSGAGRLTALAGLAGLAWLLGRRGGPLSRCVRDGRCLSCRRLDGCILPAGQYMRHAKERGDA